MMRIAVLSFCLLYMCALSPAQAADRGGNGLTIDPDDFAEMLGGAGFNAYSGLPVQMEGGLLVSRYPGNEDDFAPMAQAAPPEDANGLPPEEPAIRLRDSCEYARDGVCDEPDDCSPGTDATDCSARAIIPAAPPQRGRSDSCEYARDGVCDEPDYCSPGTDATDCSARAIIPAAPPERSLPGPRIVLQQPQNFSVFAADESVAVHLEFFPDMDGAALDMTTLSVVVRKGWFGKDITDALEPWIEEAAIRVPEVDFAGHTGEFEFEVGIGDARGRFAEAFFLITVES